jgi:phage tail P2-like protein
MTDAAAPLPSLLASLLPSLLAPNSTAVEQAVEQAVRLDLPVQVGTLWSPQLCPAALLPWLAWGLSVDVWRDSWPEAVKREVCARALPVHARAGTVFAVKTSLATLGFAADVVEWWQPGGSGQPHTARIDCFAPDVIASGGLVNAALVSLLTGVVQAAAPARVHFMIRVGERFQAATAARAATRARSVEAGPRWPQVRPHAAPVSLAARAATRARTVWRLEHLPQRRAA